MHHYPRQSLEYFTEVNINRGDAGAAQGDAVRALQYFRFYDEFAMYEDRKLAGMLPEESVSKIAARQEPFRILALVRVT